MILQFKRGKIIKNLCKSITLKKKKNQKKKGKKKQQKPIFFIM